MSILTVIGVILLLVVVWLMSIAIDAFMTKTATVNEGHNETPTRGLPPNEGHKETPTGGLPPNDSVRLSVKDYLALLEPLPVHSQLLVGVPANVNAASPQVTLELTGHLDLLRPQATGPAAELSREAKPVRKARRPSVAGSQRQTGAECETDAPFATGGSRRTECDDCDESSADHPDGDLTSKSGKPCCARSWTTMSADFDHAGPDYRKLSLEDPESCGHACLRDQPFCRAWSYGHAQKVCALKDKIAPMVESQGTTTGQTVAKGSSSMDADVDYSGNDYHTRKAGDATECSYACLSDRPRCQSWSFRPSDSTCSLKDKVPPMRASRGDYAGQLAYPNYTKPQSLGPPAPIERDGLYTIEDADGNFRLAVWDTAVDGGVTNQKPVDMVQGDYSSCTGQKCAFRFVSQSQVGANNRSQVGANNRSQVGANNRSQVGANIYAIETADGTGRLSMLNKNAQGGLKDKNPVFVYKGLQGSCAGTGTSGDCVFKLLPNDDRTWRIEAGDDSGRLAFWDKTSKWSEIYTDPATRPKANGLPVFMFIGTQAECPGNECKFKLTKVGTVPPPAPIDPNALYKIADALGNFQLVWGMNPTGNSMQSSLAMYQVADPNCEGTAAGHCTFRFAEQGSGFYSIETADGTGRLDMWGKTAGGGLKNRGPVYIYNGLQATCAGNGVMKDCLFKLVANDNGTWKIEAGDCSGKLAFWDLTSKWRPLFDDARTRPQANELPLFMCTCGQKECSHDCDFQLIKVGTAPTAGCQYTTTFSGCGDDGSSIYIQNCSGQFLRATEGQKTPNWVTAPDANCCFNLIAPPFGGQYPKNSFSLESVAVPDHFLRQSSFIMRLDDKYTKQNDDFVFQFLPAMNGQPKSFTMKPVQAGYNRSCFFAQDQVLQFQKGLCPTGDSQFKDSASFNLGTSKLKPQSLRKYTTTFGECGSGSIYIQNFDGQYLMSSFNEWIPKWVSAPNKACCFRVVSAGSDYSLESVAFPSNFLRHTDFLTIVKGFNCQNYAEIKDALPANTTQFMVSAILDVVTYSNSEAQWVQLFHAGNPDSTQRTPGVWLLNGYLYVRATSTNYWDDGGQPCAQTNILPQLQFGHKYHLLVVYDQNLIAVYLNGNLVASCPTSGQIIAYRDVYVGATPTFPLGSNINLTLSYIPGTLSQSVIGRSWKAIRDLVGTPVYPYNVGNHKLNKIVTIDADYSPGDHSYVFRLESAANGKPGVFTIKPLDMMSYRIPAGSYDNAAMASVSPGWRSFSGATEATINFVANAPGADIRVFLADPTMTVGYSVLLGGWENTACGVRSLPNGDTLAQVGIPSGTSFSQTAPNACQVSFNAAAGTINAFLNGAQVLAYSAGNSLVAGITQYNFGAGATAWALSDVSLGAKGASSERSCFAAKGSTLLLESGKCPKSASSFNLGTPRLVASARSAEPEIDPSSLYGIESSDGNFRLAVWGMTANGLANENPVAMYQGAYLTCGGYGADCTFRFGALGNGLHSIETADGSGRLAMWGKTAQGGLVNQNPVAMYAGSQATCNGTGASQDCAFKISPNGNGTWRIEAGDGTGRLAFWNWTSQWRATYEDPQTRAQANQLPVYMYTGSQAECNGADCQFRLTKIAGQKPYVAFDAPNGDCSGADGGLAQINANSGETSAELFARCQRYCNSQQECQGFSFAGDACRPKTRNCATSPYGRTKNGATFYYNPETTEYVAFDTANGDCSGMDGSFAQITANAGETGGELFKRCQETCDSTQGCQGFSFNGSSCWPKTQNCAIMPYGRTQGDGATFFYYNPNSSLAEPLQISADINAQTPILVGYVIATAAAPNVVWTGGSGSFTNAPPYKVTGLSSGTTCSAYTIGGTAKFVVYSTSRPGQATISFVDAQGTSFSLSGGYGYGSEVFFNAPASTTKVYATAAS